jgi:hypothetical protein
MDIDLSKLAAPWVPIGDSASAFVVELGREISQGHVLSGKSVEAIARRLDRDDVLFRVGSNFAVVHLAYSGRESDAAYPATELYKSWLHFVDERVARDSAEYGS